MDMQSIDGMYEVILNNKPDTIFAKRVWEGLANTFFYRVQNDPYTDRKHQLEEVMRLAMVYDVKIPSDEMQYTLKYIDESLEINGDVDLERKKDFNYEFSRTPSRKSAENL